MVVYETAPAKINLSLDVLGKREDGYHEVEMIMTTIDLTDRIELLPLANDEIKVSLESRYVPNDERNLAYQAAFLFKKKYKIPFGVHIKIEKDIPVSAGLGGGSSDAAAVLRGLNRMWKLNIPMEQLAQLGAEIGSDVPFCVYGSTAIARGRGEIIDLLPAPPSCWVVLAKPDIGVSTKEIFQALSLEDIFHPKTDDVIRALHQSNFNQLCKATGNALEKVTFALYPRVRQIKEKMIQLGSPVVTMSGSGPTLFGLFEHERQAKRIYNSLCGFCDQVYMVRMLG